MQIEQAKFAECHMPKRTGILGLGTLTPNIHFLSLLLRLEKKPWISSGHLSLAPTQKPSDTQKNRPQLAQPALVLCPASNTPCSCEQQGPAPVPALPHRPAPAQHSLMTRSVFSNNTTFFSVEIINICTAYAWPVQDKPLEGLVDGGLRLFPTLGMCSSPLLPMLMDHQEPCVLITVGHPNPAPVLWVWSCSLLPPWDRGAWTAQSPQTFTASYPLLWQDFCLQLN